MLSEGYEMMPVVKCHLIISNIISHVCAVVSTRNESASATNTTRGHPP